jgi:hypothetical protein
MKNIIIIKVDFCKTFGTNNIINTIINTSISYLMIWGGLQRQWVINLKSKVSNLGKISMGSKV